MKRDNWAMAAAGWIAFVAGCLRPPDPQIEHGNVAFDTSPDGQQIVFSAADGDLYLLHLSTLKVTQLTRTEATESTPAFSPDGQTVIYAAATPDRKGASIFARSLDGQQVRQLTNDPETSDGVPSYSGDGRSITVARAHRYRPYSMGGWTWDDWDIYVIKPDGIGLRRVTREKYRGASQPRLTPDGKSIIYSAEVPYDGKYFDRAHGGSLTTLLEVDAQGGTPPRPLLAEPPPGLFLGAWGSDPDLSSDGERIAFISDRGQPFEYDLFTMKRNGKQITRLTVTSISRYNQTPVLLPSGESVLFLAGTEWNASSRPIFSLWQMDLDGAKPRRIADSGLFTDPLHWMPEPKQRQRRNSRRQDRRLRPAPAPAGAGGVDADETSEKRPTAWVAVDTAPDWSDADLGRAAVYRCRGVRPDSEWTARVGVRQVSR